MKKNKYLLIIIGVIIANTIILIMAITMHNDKKVTQNNMDNIKKNYELFSKKVTEYNEIRTKYNEMSTVLIMDSYEKKHEDFVTLFTEYNEVIKNIDNYITNISIRCNRLYPEIEINNICNGYKTAYDKIVDLYIDDVTAYNNFIDEYNEYKKKDLTKVEMLHTKDTSKGSKEND